MRRELTASDAAWVIIRTELRHESRVYRAMFDLAADIWLPAQPRFARVHRKTKHRREWWKPAMPTIFFARIEASQFHVIADLPFCRGVERHSSGKAITLDNAELNRFRAEVEAENRETLRIGRRIHEEAKPKAKAAKIVARKPSRKIRRSIPQGRAMGRLVAHVEAVVAAARADSCGSPAAVVHPAPDRMSPDPQATSTVEPRGQRPEPAIGAE